MTTNTAVRLLASSFVASGLVVLPGLAQAQCCDGYSAATACDGKGLTRSRWCIEDTVPTGQAALPAEFCAYGDTVVSTLESVFNIKAKDVVEFQLDSQTGGAHTGTSCGHLGVGVAYDAFKGSAYGAPGFWGYLLSLHEAINDWTGMSSPGWPTDFWADHQSAFPNLMDFHIMECIGTANGDANLVKAAAAQKKRFYPGGDTADAKVVALDNVFALMPGGDGFAGFSHMFALQSGDGVRWDNLGVPNPDVKRTEYVVAYMSLAAGQRVLSTLQGPGANGGGEICNGTFDGHTGDKPYVCDSGHIDAIATAHCSIAANGKPSADLGALKSGNYANVPSGPCGATCPAECGCDTSNHCVPPWLATPPTGSGDASTDSDASTGGAATSAGGGSAAAGAPTGAGGGAPRPGGTAGSGGASNGGSASKGPTLDAGFDASAGATGGKSGSDSGCGCRLSAEPSSAERSLGLSLAALATALAGRRRRRAAR